MKYVIFLASHLLLAVSFLFPRSKKKWVFGSKFGFTNNAKYFFILLNEQKKSDEYQFVWIGKESDVEKIRRMGYIAYTRWSILGLFYSLISGVYVYDSYISDVNLYTFGFAYRVNLWHGVGIKNIERKITSGIFAAIFQSSSLVTKLIHLPLFIKPQLFLSTSPMMTQHFSSCFEIDATCCFEGMYPRCEILRWNESQIADYIERYELELQPIFKSIKKYKRTLLYLPTWRDTGFDFSKSFDFNEVNKALVKTDSLLLIKFHPWTKIHFNSDLYSNIVLLNSNIDVYPLMHYSSCLITDYSSVYYDYILLEKKDVFLYIPDYKEYISRERDLAFPYSDYTKGIIGHTFTDLLDYLYKDVHNSVSDTDEIIKIRNVFWNNRKSTSTDLFDYIVKKQ